jgi:hypothetical protein
MNSSTSELQSSHLVAQMSPAARARYSTDSEWAKASGLPKETLSRLKSQASCDLRTLAALARAAGVTFVVVPAETVVGAHFPSRLSRAHEDDLLDLSASGNIDPATWRARGPGFFMGGLAVMLASARGFEREPYMRLAEELHPGVSNPEVFGTWLTRSPVRPSRFLPMARKRKHLAQKR